MSKALITGGAGFIGSHLAEELLNRGYRVTILDDLSTGRLENLSAVSTHSGLDIVIDSIANETLVDRLISEVNVVFHLAAAVGVKLIVEDPVGVINRNVFGTEVVLKANARYRKKIILASSSEIYGKSESAPFKEDSDRILGSTVRTRWCYSCTKAIDEFLALAYWRQVQMPVVITRFFNTIGPRQIGRYGMVVPRFIDQAISRVPLTVYGDGSQIRCFMNVRDVVESLILLAESGNCHGQIFNVGSEEAVSMAGLAELIKKMTGSDSEIRLIPFEKVYSKEFEDISIRVPDISKLKKFIDYSPKFRLEETLKEIIEHKINKKTEG